MPDKDGLASAIDFTKFIVALDGALIAFLTGASFLKQVDTSWEAAAVIVGLVLLAISLACGVLVFMRGSSMLSSRNYNLADPHLKIPGLLNVAAFTLGAVAVSLLTIISLMFEMPVAPLKPALPLICIACST